MNQPSIYATEVNYPQKDNLKEQCNLFKHRIDKHIKQVATINKKQIVKQSLEYHQKIYKITDQSNHYKKRIFQQQKQFEQRIQNYLKYDVSKWTDYQLFFKSHFDNLESKIYQHRVKNAQYRNKIKIKKQDLKNLMRSKLEKTNSYKQERQQDANKANLDTKQSTVHFSYSQTGSKRIKTDSSLPSLKLVNRYERIKTIQSDFEAQKGEIKKSSYRLGNYMEPIGLVRIKKQSSMSLLLEFLKQHKLNHQDKDNWFLKVIYNTRNFSKIINFIEKKLQSKQ